MRSERGFALVITLVVSALLVAVTVEFIHEVVVDTTLRQNYADAQQASILAESGVKGGIALLKTELQGRAYCSLLDRWAQPLQLEDEKGSISFTIEDESGKLNLNSLVSTNAQRNDPGFDIFKRLLKQLDLSLDLGDSLADWVDQGEDASPGGAKSAYYKTLHPPYMAKRAPFDTVEELGLVKGFTPKVMERLRPFVTVYPNDSSVQAVAINLNTAAPELIKALIDGVAEDQVALLLDSRKTTMFDAKGKFTIVSPGIAKIVGATPNRVGVGEERIFRIVAQGKVGDATRVIEAVVKPLDSPPNILYWREY